MAHIYASPESKNSLLPSVGFDESGNTGPDLLNRDQPVFALASVALSEADAAKLLGSCVGTEHHSVSLRQSREGRERMLKVLNSDALGPSTVKVAVMHKPFMVTTKIVDLLIEPIAAGVGLDLYQQGMHLGLSNLFHSSWPVFDAAGFDHITSSFLAWARDPTDLTARPLAAAIRRMAVHAPEAIEQVLFVAADVLDANPGYFTGSGDISGLDPAGPALIGLLHEWCAQLGGIQVVHDDSKEVMHWLPHIRRLSDPKQAPAEFQVWNGETLRYPLSVTDISLDESEASAQIQLADLIAGAATIAFGSRVRPPKTKLRRFAAEVLSSELPSWVIGASVWPTTDFGPEELGAQPGQTDWIIDRIARW